MSEIRCSQCNALNRDTARYCAECGAPLLAGISRSTGAGQASAAGNTTPTRPGRLLHGRYRIEQELGRGGFGAVYSAWDTNLDHKCAVKENLEITPEAQRQFSREATILANLSHPNLPRVTDHFSIPNEGQYLVMDFVEGEDLESMLGRQGRLGVEQAVNWVIQVADALIYLHGQQPPVVHRDIKPANIRITPDGRAMLVDFGLVKVYNPQLKTTLGARAVTPGYAPPEQYGHGRTDSRTDIYALGATLYRLLTGLDPLESVLRVTGGSMTSLREASPQTSAQVQQVVERAMALEPGARYQTAAEFKEALQKCLAPRPEPVLVARPPARPSVQPLSAPEIAVQRPSTGPASPQEASQKRRSPLLWVLIGGVILAGLFGISMLGGLFYFIGHSTSRTPTSTSISVANRSTPTATRGQARSTPLNPTPLPAFRSKDPETYVHLAFQEPDTLDPALDYETTGQGIIANIFDTLIAYRKNDPGVFIPQIAVDVPSLDNGGVSPDGLIYRFKIRQGVQFHNGYPLTAEDVAYTFRRGMLQGGSYSPQWLLTEPLLGAGVYDVAGLVDPALVNNPQSLAKANADKLVQVCQRVVESVQVEGDEVVFRLAQPWSPFLATLAGGTGSILSKDWVIQNGGWDGDCASWPRYYAPTYNDINQKALGTSPVGTGPYVLDHWEGGKEIVLTANENYWRPTPAWEGGPSGPPALKLVTIRQVDDFGARLAQLQAGEADSIEYGSNVNWPKLDALVGQICSLNDSDCQASERPDGPLALIHGGPSVNRTDVFFNFAIDAQNSNDYLGSGKLDGNGIPPDFFANVHVRRAFADCFNYNTYLDQYLQGEGIRTIDVMLPGMPGYDPNSPHYVYSPDRCQDELRQAEFNGRTVWETGFKMVFPYPSNSLVTEETRLLGQIFHDELAAVDPKFQVELREIGNSDYYDQRNTGQLPIFPASWLEDIHDPHNWLQTYSVGYYARLQNMPSDLYTKLGDFVTRGVSAVDPEERGRIYREFNQVYYEDVPAILLFTDIGRHYQQRWVHGWYDNPVNPGINFYMLRKD